MQLLSGEDLGDIIHRHRQSRSDPRVPLRTCVTIAKQITALLERLHGMGIVHRDIKPKYVNILSIDGNGLEQL